MPYLRRGSLYRSFSAPRLQGGRGLGQFTSVANEIQQLEGWFTGSVSQTNNNPGNLMYAGQPGATGQTAAGFAIFPSYQAGYQALQNQIALDASRGLTISQFASKYAPAQDGNDPTSYAAQIAAATGLSVNDPLSSADTSMLAAAIPASSPDLSSASDVSSFSSAPPDNTLLYVGLGLAAGALALYAVG
jgi:hypothetical protein